MYVVCTIYNLETGFGKLLYFSLSQRLEHLLRIPRLISIDQQKITYKMICSFHSSAVSSPKSHWFIFLTGDCFSKQWFIFIKAPRRLKSLVFWLFFSHGRPLELIAIVFGSLAKFLLLVFIMLQWNGTLYITLIVQMLTSAGFDYGFASENGANLGAMGIAYSSVSTSLIMFLVSLIIVWFKLKFNFKEVGYLMAFFTELASF